MTQNNDDVKEMIRLQVYSAICQALGDDRFDEEIAVEAADSILASIPAPAGGAEWKNTEKGYPHALCAIEGCLRDSQDMSGWQDISTAPMDGRVIIVDGGTVSFCPHGGWYSHHAQRYLSWAPTHWMPFPEFRPNSLASPKPPTNEAGHE